MKQIEHVPTHEQISQRAKKLWQLAGSPTGRDAEFWSAAESELMHDQQETKRKAEANPAPRVLGDVSSGPVPTTAPRVSRGKGK